MIRAAETNEGTVTGSATVRILKPESEAGAGATPKLERTPVLDNDGVIRLVEAGFSEGTIIKRIQESPVDFDLSRQARRTVQETSHRSDRRRDGCGDGKDW